MLTVWEGPIRCWSSASRKTSTMPVKLLVTSLVTAFNLGLALLVYLKDPSRWVNRTFAVKVFGVLGATLTLAAISTPWIVATLTTEAGSPKVRYGPLYPLFAVYIVGSVGYSFITIFHKIRVARGAERLQLKYLFIGLLIPGLLVTVTNLLIPLAFGTSQFSQYGPLFSFLMIAMIAHAIEKGEEG